MQGNIRHKCYYSRMCRVLRLPKRRVNSTCGGAERLERRWLTLTVDIRQTREGKEHSRQLHSQSGVLGTAGRSENQMGGWGGDGNRGCGGRVQAQSEHMDC